jgi:hypothetical protein
MNTVNIISPYRHNGTWVFDDARHDLVREPFISGADVLIDHAVVDIPNAAEGFNLIFSAGPFPGHQYRLAWISTAGESPNGGFAHLIHLTQEFGSKRYAK